MRRVPDPAKGSCRIGVASTFPCLRRTLFTLNLPMLRPLLTSLAIMLVFGAIGCCPAQQGDSASATQSPEPSEGVERMASFSRFIGGEWRMGAPGMTAVMIETWTWGPGRHSVLASTEGVNVADENSPWRAVQVFYWHPGLKQICVFGLSPYSNGVSEGSISFEGDVADGMFDLYQTNQSPRARKMGLHWAFEGPDKYHDVLLEATGPEGLKTLAEWDHHRSYAPASPRPLDGVKVPRPPDTLSAFVPLLNPDWGARLEWRSGGDADVRITFEWIPFADCIRARITSPTKDGAQTHLFDVYLYRHTGTGALRCLALSDKGGVYVGDVTVLAGGSLQFSLMGHEAEKAVPYELRTEMEKDGAIRSTATLQGESAPRILVWKKMERETGLEPATSSLEGWSSTN